MSFYEYLIAMLQEARRVLFTLAGLRKIYFRDEETDQLESKWELEENVNDQVPTQGATQLIGEVDRDRLGVVNDVDYTVTDFDVSYASSSYLGESLLEHNYVEHTLDKSLLEDPPLVHQQSALLISYDTILHSTPATPIALEDEFDSKFSSKTLPSIDNVELIKRDKPRSGSEISTCSTISCPDIEVEGFEVLCSEEGKVEVKVSKSSKKRSKKKSSAVSAAQNTTSVVTSTATVDLSKTLTMESSSVHVNAVNAVNQPINTITSPLKSSLAPKKKTSHHKSKQAKRHIHWGVVEEIFFTRSVALSSVPNKGLYPLGLGGEARDSAVPVAAKVSVDNHFLEQQMLLRERFITLGLGPIPDSLLAKQAPPPDIVVKDAKAPKKGGSKKAPVTITNSSISTATSTPTVAVKDFAPTIFESRQFDFRPISNPLFGPLPEYDRISLLGQVHGGSAAVDSTTTSLLADTNKEIKIIQTSRQNHPSCTCKPLKIDKLSVTKLRSELLSATSSSSSSSSSSFTTTSVEQTSDGVVVCSPVSVSAPCDDVAGGDGDGNKLPQDRRKVFSKDEVEKLSKAELMTELREVLRHCQLCMANQCECYQLSIPCSSYGCPCLRRVESSLGQSCANPFGYQFFSAEAVKAYRQEVLSEVKSKGILFIAVK